MDWQMLATWGWSLASAGLGWWLHVLWTRHHEMAKQLNDLALKQQKDISDAQLHAEREYARKTDIAPLLRDIRDVVQRIDEKQETRLNRLEDAVFKK